MEHYRLGHNFSSPFFFSFPRGAKECLPRRSASRGLEPTPAWLKSATKTQL
ncbi:hypothetical protein THIOM_002488 [Candidatus Thiomargarita nelsonii]|uniref:Uncharacterized protein n=1 Tax=Candidatus Thiomargarita nelsonii TaxID=1003181 RepID=A0A176S148_9GAMM|nr:hypothetical protein THIOM_002488 [Candidatus Thiomargarita nelsonii]